MNVLTGIRSLFDNQTFKYAPDARGPSPLRVFSFVFLHGGCLAALWVGWSPIAVGLALGLYVLRAFFITAFYHRLFSHRAYKTSRAAQFIFAVLGNSAIQRGPLWWAAHHRYHHRNSDREGDPHSPHIHGIYDGHIGWITHRENFATRFELVPDLAKFPELRFLDRFDMVVPAIYAAALFGLGALLQRAAPSLGTNGPQMFVWGFFISTTILFHVTCLVNSAAHMMGRRRFATPDKSRNSLIVALLTLGEGWHNNHHHYQASVRQGFYWWEIDLTYYALRLLAACRVIWDLKPVPSKVLETGRIDREPAAA